MLKPKATRYFMHFFLIPTLALVFFAFEAQARDVVGVIKRLEDTVSVKRGEKELWPSVGGFIYPGDIVSTDANSKVHIRFRDETELIIGQDSQVLIDEYVYDDQQSSQNTIRFNIVKGGFHYMSGLITKQNRDAVLLQTPFGKIGIRGTKIWGGIFDQECQVYVEDGGINISNDHGFVAVDAGQGVDILDKNDAPLPAEVWTSDDIKWIKELVAFK